MLSTEIDWNAVQIQYEILGYTVEHLAELYNFSIEAITNLIETKGWEQQALISKNQITQITPNTPESYLDSISENAVTEFSILTIHKQLQLRPKFTQLENIIITKAISAANAVDTNIPSAATKLKILTDILRNLYEHTGLLKKINTADEDYANVSRFENDSFIEQMTKATKTAFKDEITTIAQKSETNKPVSIQ